MDRAEPWFCGFGVRRKTGSILSNSELLQVWSSEKGLGRNFVRQVRSLEKCKFHGWFGVRRKERAGPWFGRFAEKTGPNPGLAGTEFEEWVGPNPGLAGSEK